MRVAIVVAARDAADTLAETLASLADQTLPDWEAAIVDDGSRDTTLELARCWARAEPRLRVLTQPAAGVSAARNAGIAATHAPWLLFLDADDRLEPDQLAQLLAARAAQPEAALLYCDWARLAPDGERLPEACHRVSGDLFPLLARLSAFPVHGGLVEREALRRAGLFDPSLATCEDWDLWQRLARTGARFAHVPGPTALYRMRPASLSLDAAAMLRDGLRVIARGHGPDPRVAQPCPEHAAGLPERGRLATQYHYLCWCAGLVLGRGDDARPLLAQLEPTREPGLDPETVADALLRAAPLPSCRPPQAWPELWPQLEPLLARFLEALEERSRTPALARRAHTALERRILPLIPPPGGALGRFLVARVDLAAPLPALRPPPHCDRVQLRVHEAGEPLGELELPVCDGSVPTCVLADAVAAALAWPILNHFFERSLYPQLRFERSERGTALRRGALVLAEDLGADVRAAAHLHADWTLFLQELWGCPDWPLGRFYDPQFAADPGPARPVHSGRVELEVSAPLPELVSEAHAPFELVLTVGGVATALVPLAAGADGRVSAQRLRSALSLAGGLELCRAAVREALIGQPWDDARPLRERLQVAARQAAQGPAPAATLHAALLPRRGGELGAPGVSRRACLPLAARGELEDSAHASAEPPLQLPPGAGPPDALLYAPECLPAGAALAAGPAIAAQARPAAAPMRPHDRHHFETLFAREADPWRYESEYERLKYEQTLSLLPRRRPRRALELGCAEGHLTQQLAPRVDALLAADLSQIALERAERRCRGLGVRFLQLDLVRDPLPGEFELIVCSELLYYVGDRAALRTAAHKLARALRPAGRLVLAHAHLLVDDPERTGFDWDLPFGARVIGETLAATPGLELEQEIRTPLYRVAAFRRPPRRPWPRLRARPAVLRSCAEQPTPLPLHVAAHVRWRAGAPGRAAAPPPEPPRLTILAYHRIASEGGARLAEWRVAPEVFERQLRYLRDAGFRTPSLAAAQHALTQPQAAGRAVILSFDDGYLDFYTHARPLLQRYGFSALVFAVSERVGETSTWDRAHGEERPLMDWRQLRELRDAGFSIGSHSATHAPLTALSPAAVVREAAGSRARLARALGCPIEAFAYPYGDCDAAVRHLVGACGYRFGLTTESRAVVRSHAEHPLALPRICVRGGWSFADFIAALG